MESKIKKKPKEKISVKEKSKGQNKNPEKITNNNIIDEFSTSWSDEKAEHDAHGRIKKTYRGYPYLKKSLRFYKKYWKLMSVTFFVSLIVAGLGILSPIFSERLMSGFTNFNYDIVVKSALYLLIVDLVISAIDYLAQYLFITTQNGVSLSIKKELSDCMTRLNTRNFDKTNSGKLINLINRDAEGLAGLGTQIISLVTSIIGRLAFLGYALYLNLWLGLLIVAEMIFMYIMESFRIRVRYVDMKEYMKIRDKGTGIISEIVRGIRDIRLLNLRKETLKKSDGIQDQLLKQDKKTVLHRQAFNRGLWIGQALLEFAFLVLAAGLVVKGHATVAAALTLYMFKGRLVSLMSWITNIKEYAKDGELSASRIFRILDGYNYGYEKFGTEQIQEPVGRIEFKDVKFAYEEEMPVLKGASFVIEPNTTVAIVGESGEGKTTLLNLINRMYDKQEGEILIDGYKVETLTEESLRGVVTTVSQDPYIFNMTIKENLLLVNPKATKEEMDDACKKAMIYDFVRAQPKKYKSNIGENGIVLSGGQKQRLAIARALLKKDSKVILFDEATSSLDNENQGKIKQVIDALDDTHTVIIVAHRLSTIVDCHKIIVLKNGKVMAEGNHKELMKKCELYRKLYIQEENSQKEEKV